jgi:hypothetical protein
MNGPIKPFAMREPWMDSIAIALIQEDHHGNRYAAEPVEFSKVDRGARTEPTIRLQWEDAQRLVDELWACGIRPSQGIGSAGQLGATEKHLADMQKIAIGALKAAEDNSRIVLDMLRGRVIRPEPEIILAPVKR